MIEFADYTEEKRIIRISGICVPVGNEKGVAECF